MLQPLSSSFQSISLLFIFKLFDSKVSIFSQIFSIGVLYYTHHQTFHQNDVILIYNYQKLTSSFFVHLFLKSSVCGYSFVSWHFIEIWLFTLCSTCHFSVCFNQIQSLTQQKFYPQQSIPLESD